MCVGEHEVSPRHTCVASTLLQLAQHEVQLGEGGEALDALLQNNSLCSQVPSLSLYNG